MFFWYTQPMKKQKTKKSVILSVLLGMAVCLFFSAPAAAESQEPEKADITPAVAEENPFFKAFDTPFGLPPFDQIKDGHFIAAFKKGMEIDRREIQDIIDNPEAPTFANTVEAMEKTGEMLGQVSRVFFHLYGVDTNQERQKIAQEIIPLLSQHRSFIALNEKLFQKIKAVYEKKDTLDLNPEQKKLLEETFRAFVRSGANLDPKKKERVREISEEISVLGLKFRNNVLADTNNFKMFLDQESDLEGLPQSVVDAAAQAAEEEGQKGKWLFTPHKPSWIPFLQYSKKRELREKLYKGFINLGDNNNEYDNKKIISRIAALRAEFAGIMGYKTYADFRLEVNMAKNPGNVYKLLDQLWVPSLKMAQNEAQTLQAQIDREDGNFKLESWDWWYYTEKLRKEKYDLDDEALRPYFELNHVRQGAFTVANRLYGLQFIEKKDIPNYHPDAQVFEVLEADGTHLGILYTDYFYRGSKRAGAWCGDLRVHSNIDGKKVHPVVYCVGNFSLPVGDKPSLLTFDEALTLFHEFGHALHFLFNKTTYPGLSEPPWDFIELPSQIMEHWCAEPDVLKLYAKHYQTGEVIPQEMVDKLVKSSQFNQGFTTTEYLAACYLDMNWHTLPEPIEMDTDSFEKSFFKKIGLIPEIVSRYRSTYFSHIIGGYDAGYYSYIWAEVLDCDAFQAFKETSLFDATTAKRFRDNVLEKGGSEDPMVLYVRFRGAEPKIDGLLKKRGLN